jgi:AcrR family transcriptional regulator
MMTQTENQLAEQILDRALALAEADSWETVQLRTIAAELDISLDQIRRVYPQKDDLVEAWFDRADRAILDQEAMAEFLALPERDRLQRIIMRWFQVLAPHRRVTCEMLRYKLEFGHIHLQVLGVMRISRTVQWFREAASREAQGLRRILDETVISGIYLISFARWLYDDSPDSQRTDKFLKQALGQSPGLIAGKQCPGWRAQQRSQTRGASEAAAEPRCTQGG